MEVCIFPPMTYLDYLNNLLQDLPISIGGQNCHYKLSGAFTGEVSPKFLRDTGCEYVIIGHSERRIFNYEKNDEIKLRVQSAINNNLKTILCVGEDLNDRKKGNAVKFIKKQLVECLPNNFEDSFIAYEPIWSIGTGKTPSLSEISEMLQNIKEVFFKISDKKIKVLYGGSVNVDNISDILKIKLQTRENV